jgi:xanthine dehydrogenase accessory factor
MLVWADPSKDGGQSGTVGGGTLEFEAVRRARALLAAPPSPNPSPNSSARGGGEALAAVRVERIPLGPALGQCCGGAVTLVTSVVNAAALDAVAGQAVVATGLGEMPLAVRRMLAAARGQGVVAAALVDGWLVEPVAVPARQIWVWGAGHVGRALVSVLAPLPGVAVTWVDTGEARFPEVVPEGVVPVWAADVAGLVAHAPTGAEHLIVTYSHALDLELCHRLLGRGFGFCGLIGSATKWARFRSRLLALGHMPGATERITCPIGDVSLGKHPQAIAVGVAVQILTNKCKSETEITDDNHGDRRGRKA